MRNLTAREHSLVSGGSIQDLTADLVPSETITLISGSILGYAAGTLLARSLYYGYIATFAVELAGGYLGFELGGAIWEANHNHLACCNKPINP